MLSAYEKFIREAMRRRIFSQAGLKKLKRQIAREFKIDTPRTDKIRDFYRRMIKTGKMKECRRLLQALVLKRTRTLSGVSVVAVLTRDYPCGSDCLYCPEEKQMPKSYLSNEPAVMRAIRLDFSPYWQMNKRLEVLEYNGHDVSKVELIVMGGTFSHLPKIYQYWFIKECFRGANEYTGLDNKEKFKKIKEPFSKGKDFEKLNILRRELDKEKRKNIKAGCRIVGLTLETRPDAVTITELKRFRELGCTRVEIGAQSIYGKVLKKNRRGHGRQAIIRATAYLKEMGFKINYHIMPGLLGSNLKMDEAMFLELFSCADFRPDMLKIYPCVVTKEADLYDLWKRGKYAPYTNKQLAGLLARIKRRIPQYVRIARLIRDIPTVSIKAGPNIPNLRDVLKSKGVKCRCIRCREAGRSLVVSCGGKKEKIFLDRLDYRASGGKEIFLQFVSGKEKRLHAFLRLRIPAFVLARKEARGRRRALGLGAKKAPEKELAGCGIIREVHSYGQVAPVGRKIKGTSQHRGFGKRLIRRAEKITRDEFLLKKIAVIAACGTKDYYFGLGYKEEGNYMTKELFNKAKMF
ncbi:MAG: tRNA uridine(34) 5-carboxymethylaminomethyl modification radical SAM/GNAT enzyme Elp3 [Patescibacteria group bacterium]|nr:tRNA uridine(34) 5-carboxymethylaminomethyl modification radical SAM/GNAT enzyme Elp3 [Patescibacteria group bacterium]